MALSNSAAAAYGLLAMYAMDMNRIGGPTRPAAAPGLEGAGWTLVAYITASDFVFPPNGPIQLGAETVYLGFVAKNASGDFVAVVRGTDGIVEWLKDAQFAPVLYAPTLQLKGDVAGAPALVVEQGFWTVYKSMKVTDPKGVPLGDPVPAISALVGANANLTVIGHSLGSAIATYLTLDLVRGVLGDRTSACLFASPHTGNKAFVDLFDRTVRDYRMFNYILDMVPRVPLGPDYSPLPRRTVIQPATAEANIKLDLLCNHHVVCYSAMLDYEATQEAITPVPAGEEGSVVCILGPETGQPTLAKQLVSDLMGFVPV